MSVRFESIGTVRSNVRDPQPHGWDSVESRIELRADLSATTSGLAGYSHVTVLFALHLVPPERRVTALRLAPEIPEQGILATRSQLRPNPIGVTVCELLSVDAAVLRVRGLDAVDGTPVLDIRPYIPHYDSLPGARVPEWARPPG